MKRRLVSSLFISAGLALAALLPSQAAGLKRHQADLLIVGATESGWAAAIQAARMGVERIVIVHDGDWYGGQYTEQALACVDENKGPGKVGWGVDWHPMKRSFHRSGLFKELMDRIEAFNTGKYGSPMPGKPWHGPSTFRPAEAEAIFREMIQPYVDSGQIAVFWRYQPQQVLPPVKEGGQRKRIEGVVFSPMANGEKDGADLEVKAAMTIDASDWGEVIQLSGAAYECGPDPHSRYGEPSAPKDPEENPPNEMNPITWAMIIAESEGETPIPRPANFDDRNYPRATAFSRTEFSKLKWDNPKPGAGSIAHWPPAGQASKRQLSVYSVRRIVDGYSSKDGRTSILLNYMNGQDYPLERLPQRVVDALEANEKGASLKNIVEMTRMQRDIVFADAKRHSLGVLYHMQNFVHQRAEDKTNSLRNFLLSDEFGTADHLPPKPYIREGLRLKAMYMMREQDARNTDGVTKDRARERFAQAMYPDGLFAWQFHYDFHRTGRTFLAEEGTGGPWIDYHKANRHTKFISDRSVFPLRSLIPQTMDGLLGAQGNVGYSSIVSAAIRLHDQRVHIGQAAGATAAVSLREGVEPREMVYDPKLFELVLEGLCSEKRQGTVVPLLLFPWRDLPADHPAFVAVNRLTALGCLPWEATAVDFRPDDPAQDGWIDGGSSFPVPKIDGQTRGELAMEMWAMHRSTGFHRDAYPRGAAGDVDGDGIADRDDALLFTPNEPIVWEVREEPLVLSAETDGLPGEMGRGARHVDFGPAKAALAPGWRRDAGQPFDHARGFGWKRDLSANHRRRGEVAEGWRDTFIFTRSRDVWECAIENGSYEVVVCIGDSEHPQPGQNLAVEGRPLVADHDTAGGEWLETKIETAVDDGRLTVTIGGEAGGTNTCLNWLIIRPVKK